MSHEIATPRFIPLGRYVGLGLALFALGFWGGSRFVSWLGRESGATVYYSTLEPEALQILAESRNGSRAHARIFQLRLFLQEQGVKNDQPAMIVHQASVETFIERDSRGRCYLIFTQVASRVPPDLEARARASAVDDVFGLVQVPCAASAVR